MIFRAPVSLRQKYEDFAKKLDSLSNSNINGCGILKLADEFVVFGRKALAKEPNKWRQHVNVARRIVHETIPKNILEIGCNDALLPQSEELVAILPILPPKMPVKPTIDVNQINKILTEFYHQIIDGKKTIKDQVETKDGKSTREQLERLGVQFGKEMKSM